MAEINVYQQYFVAEGSFGGVERHGASVLLISNSEAGQIRYEAAVSFFPHRDPEDFAVSYDAFFSKVLYEAASRRSKKREEQLLNKLRQEVDVLAEEAGAIVFWDQPLTEVRRG